MEIAEMLAVAARRWLSIVVVTLLALGAGLAAMTVLPKQYQSHTEVYVTTTGGDTSDQLLSAFNLAQDRARAYAQTVTAPLVLAPVAERTDYPGGAGALERNVSTEVAPDSVIISVTVTDADARRATEVARGITAELDRVVPTLEGGSSSARLTVIREATEPASPASPDRRIVLALSLAAGLALGSLLALVRDRRAQRPVGTAPELVTDQER